MILAALCAFAAAATAGIFLATRHFLRKRLPVWVAVVHGLGGATGFLLVLLTVVWNPEFALARQALYLFIATIALGVVNLLFHVRRVRHRTSLILLHGMTAVSGVSTLLYALLFAGPPSSDAATAAATPTTPATASAAPAEPPAAATASASADVAPAPSASAAPAPGEPTVDDSTRRTLAQSIAFEAKSAQIDPGSLSVISEVAAALKQHPEITLVQVQGHADERGGDGRNLELTRQRAAAVVSALVAAGVMRSRLRSAGFGARCPARTECQQADAPESCHAPDAWQQDRRVVFVPLNVGKTPFRGELVCERAAELLSPADRAFHAPTAK